MNPGVVSGTNGGEVFKGILTAFSHGNLVMDVNPAALATSLALAGRMRASSLIPKSNLMEKVCRDGGALVSGG